MTDESSDHVAAYTISQAMTATFTDLYLRQTFLFFIESGSKRVLTSSQELVGEEGDLLIFPAASMVTMENRPVLDRSYRAVGVAFPEALVRAVFGEGLRRRDRVQILHADPHEPHTLLPLIMDTLENRTLPEAIRDHRMVEPLIWLKDHGVHLPTASAEAPLSRVRRLIETDLSRPWRAAEVAQHLAMSESTMRRLLAAVGQSFSRTLLNTRLENALSRLQTSQMPISEIALDCGFKTPSHFSEAFRRRFGIAPRDIRAKHD